MVKYLLKTTVTGSPDNKAFPNKSRVYYTGMNSASTVSATVLEEDVSDIELAKKRLAANCGYHTLRGAKVGLSHANKSNECESARGFNRFVTEIIEVHC